MAERVPDYTVVPYMYNTGSLSIESTCPHRSHVISSTRPYGHSRARVHSPWNEPLGLFTRKAAVTNLLVALAMHLTPLHA